MRPALPLVWWVVLLPREPDPVEDPLAFFLMREDAERWRAAHVPSGVVRQMALAVRLGPLA